MNTTMMMRTTSTVGHVLHFVMTGVYFKAGPSFSESMDVTIELGLCLNLLAIKLALGE